MIGAPPLILCQSWFFEMLSFCPTQPSDACNPLTELPFSVPGNPVFFVLTFNEMWLCFCFIALEFVVFIRCIQFLSHSVSFTSLIRYRYHESSKFRTSSSGIPGFRCRLLMSNPSLP